MANRDPRVSLYIRESAPFARPILRHLRQLINAGGPEIEETIKWGMPTFMYRGKIVCGIAAFKGHCAFWFREGSEVVGRKPKEAMGHFGRITDLGDLPSPARIKSFVKKAMSRIERTGAPTGGSDRRIRAAALMRS